MPRSWPPILACVSELSSGARNELKTATGFAKMFNPVPPVAVLPWVPTLVALSPFTPECRLLPKFSAPVGIAPTGAADVAPNSCPPPPTSTFNGRPVYQLTIGLSDQPCVTLSHAPWPLPNGSSQCASVLKTNLRSNADVP